MTKAVKWPLVDFQKQNQSFTNLKLFNKSFPIYEKMESRFDGSKWSDFLSGPALMWSTNEKK